jgi:sugar phosphate isomerase/epimerase
MTEMPPIRDLGRTDNVPVGLRLAIQETLLTGTDDAARVRQAAELGVTGIEFNAAGLSQRVDAICAALAGSTVQAATVALSTGFNFVAEDEPTRQHALDALRHAMTDAVDIGADGVVLVPHTGPLALPDLMPLKAPLQIAVELMTLHLRQLADLAYVFGLTLYLHPRNRYETAFLNRLDQGVELRRRIKFNEHVLLAADTFHSSLTEDRPLAALADAASSVGLVYLAENTGKLPGTGSVDFAAVRAQLDGVNGWAVVTDYGSDDADRPGPRAVRRAIEQVKAAGF